MTDPDPPSSNQLDRPDDEPPAPQQAGGPVIHGGIEAGRDVNFAAEQTVNNYTVNHYTFSQHQQRLDAYVELLQRLAASTPAQALREPKPPLTNGLPLDRLRMIMARAVLDWEPPLVAADAPLDEVMQRSLVAAMLLPLVVSPLALIVKGNWALGRLASEEIAIMVQLEGLPYIRRQAPLDRDDVAQAHLALTHTLADPQYAEGCARLLTDLAEGDGRAALAVAWIERNRSSGTTPAPPGAWADHQRGSGAPQTPPVIHLLAAGALGGAASGVILLTVMEWLRPTSPAVAPPKPAPTPPPSPGPLTIPVYVNQWQAELDWRNEQFGAPAGYWCYVRPGRYRIGGWKPKQPHANLDMPAFWIARVPLVVEQYAMFIATGGYHERQWWTPKGWGWRLDYKRTKPWRWRESPFNSRSQQALVGVGCNEATAFCAWLSAQVRLPNGYRVRLPSEAEWEVAAAFAADGQRRTYPWGETKPTSRHAVFDRDSQKGAPDVATCPAGAAACGALDLVGTIWEYCANNWEDYPAAAASVLEDFPVGDWLIPFRGGSYGQYSTNVQCGARDWSHVYSRYDGIYTFGFRVVLAPSLAHLS